MKKRLSAVLLTLLLCLQLLPGSALAAEEQPVPLWSAPEDAASVAITGTRDLAVLAERCALDSWSEGRTVVLTADLDLTGMSYQPVPSFRGTFDGGGHTIKGLKLARKGSRQGLFRVVEAGGLIMDLKLEGTVTPGGSKCSVGLLAGENAGVIRNCTVVGTVAGRTDVGGITGVNTGRLENCRADVTVTGMENTGGVCGRSTGVLEGCTGSGEVNTVTPSENVTDPVMNTGGVVGYSEGTVTGCTGRALVGYPHTGYNVGGVVGSHRGLLTGCINTGEIRGRKAVGGICGRFTPDLELDYGQDPLERLNTALSGLSSSLLALSDEVAGTVDRGTERMDGLNEELGGLRDAASGSLDRQKEFARTALDSIHERLKSINDASGEVQEVLSTFSDESRREMNNLVDDLIDLRKAAHGLTSAGDKAVTDTAAALEKRTGDMEGRTEKITAASGALASDLGKISLFAVKAGVIMSEDLTDSQRLTRLAEAARDSGVTDDSGALTVDPVGHITEINTQKGLLAADLAALTGDLDRIVRNTSSSVGSARHDLSQASMGITREMSEFNGSCSRLSDGMEAQLEQISGDMDSIEDKLKEWRDLADGEDDSASAAIDGHLDELDRQLDELMQGVRDSNEAVHTRADQVVLSLDEVRVAAHGLKDKPEYSLDDRSEQESLTSGVVRSSRNEADIAGDANVGGVVGLVSFQMSDDPEEDELNWEGDGDGGLMGDITAVVCAAVESCRNTGGITARNESAGGIAGRVDLGVVRDGLSTGDVTVENGSGCGGIVGRCTAGSVRDSSACCTLTGVDGVGGVTGLGGDLRNCRAMVTVDGSGEQLGSVSGWTDGELEGNFAVREGLGAVDGTDLSGRAQCLPYEEFAAMEGLSEDFLHFELTFVADGKVLKTVPFAYGGSIDPAEVPEIPKWEGCYAQWEPFALSGLRRSRRVEAVYTPWDTTVSSGGSRPELLAEGSFSPRASICLEPIASGEMPEGRSITAEWRYTITDPERTVPETVRLRVLAESGGKHAAVAIRVDGELIQVKDAGREGSYLVFDAPSAGEVAVLSGSPIPFTILAVGCGAAALLLVTLLLGRRKKKAARKAAEQTAGAEK